MFAPFPQEEAFRVCQKVFDGLREGLFKIEQVAKKSSERLDQGLMLGILVCQEDEALTDETLTKEGLSCDKKSFAPSFPPSSNHQPLLETKCQPTETHKKKYLLALSGNAKEFILDQKNSLNLTLVPPIVSPQKIEEALSQNDLKIHQLTDEIKEEKSVEKKAALKKERLLLCNQSLQKVNSLYSFHTACGKVLSLTEILKKTNKSRLAPTGTGDCCAPKLLDYAYSHSLKPLSMCEIFLQSDILEGFSHLSTEKNKKFTQFSTDFSTDKQNCGKLYPPCDTRCALILPEMLGLNILYRDEDICLVNKQSGLLSVPGRGPEKQDCIESRLKRLFPQTIAQPAVHRLDMETSGLMLLAFTKEAHREMNRQFEAGLVKKEYVALLDGILSKKGIASHGQMELYFRLDVENRPHQIWDDVYGKKAVTEWQILDVEKYHSPDGQLKNVTRVLFMPHTGRTHQLRLASADSHGFSTPIIGDSLYGKCLEGERLMLHAKKISFLHPRTGQRMEFTCDEDF